MTAMGLAFNHTPFSCRRLIELTSSTIFGSNSKKAFAGIQQAVFDIFKPIELVLKIIYHFFFENKRNTATKVRKNFLFLFSLTLERMEFSILFAFAELLSKLIFQL